VRRHATRQPRAHLATNFVTNPVRRPELVTFFALRSKNVTNYDRAGGFVTLFGPGSGRSESGGLSP
jgi:hypothetical protein